MKHLVIGDIHGCHEELMALLDMVGPTPEDRIITIGDMLDRGPDSEKVADFFRLNDQAAALMGNHEHKHILSHDDIIRPSLAQKITRRQFSATGYEDPIHWIRNFPVFLETEHAVLLHGFFEPGVPLGEQKKQVILGTRNGELYLKKNYDKPWYELCNPEKPIIAGHRDNSKRGEVMMVNDTVFFLDTGCCYGKKLSAILLPDFKIYQVKSRKNYWGIIKQQHAGGKRT